MANVSSDEEDYMSDAFLAKCENKRPGLVPERVARQYKNEKKHKELNVRNQIKPRRLVEAEKRDEGLKSAIDSNNKGFALLQKMGYKPGMAIGKKGTGRIEPIPLEVRTGRGGLGREAEAKRKQEEMASMRALLAKKRQKMEETGRTDFRARQSEKMAEKRAEGDLHKSQKVCEHLDSTKGMTEPAEKYFWPPRHLAENKEDEDDDTDEDEEEEDEEEEDDDDDVLNLSVHEQLRILTQYLRDTHIYCVWCGTVFDDKDDLAQNCLGDTAQAHDE